jgi:hypothetical protein
MPIWSCEEAHIMDLVHPVEDGGSQSSTLYVSRRRGRRKRSSKSVFERYTQFERLIRRGTTEENKSAFQYKKKTRRIEEEEDTHTTSKMLEEYFKGSDFGVVVPD